MSGCNLEYTVLEEIEEWLWTLIEEYPHDIWGIERIYELVAKELGIVNYLKGDDENVPCY